MGSAAIPEEDAVQPSVQAACSPPRHTSAQHLHLTPLQLTRSHLPSPAQSPDAAEWRQSWDDSESPLPDLGTRDQTVHPPECQGCAMTLSSPRMTPSMLPPQTPQTMVNLARTPRMSMTPQVDCGGGPSHTPRASMGSSRTPRASMTPQIDCSDRAPRNSMTPKIDCSSFDLPRAQTVAQENRGSGAHTADVSSGRSVTPTRNLAADLVVAQGPSVPTQTHSRRTKNLTAGGLDGGLDAPPQLESRPKRGFRSISPGRYPHPTSDSLTARSGSARSEPAYNGTHRGAPPPEYLPPRREPREDGVCGVGQCTVQ